MKKLVFLCLPIIAMIICGCPDENVPQPIIGVSEILPLTVGNKWAYKREYSYRDDKGNTISKEETSITTIDSVRVMGGKKIFAERTIVSGKEAPLRNYTFVDTAGCWSSDYKGTALSLRAKFPAEVGYKWNEMTIGVRDGFGNYLGHFFIYSYVVSTNITISANNKDYNCYQYRMQLCDATTKEPIANSYLDTYYAINTGLVKVVQLHEGFEIARIELTDYFPQINYPFTIGKVKSKDTELTKFFHTIIK